MEYKPKMGAPTLLNDDVHKIIVDAVRQDLLLTQGARAASISNWTLKNWMVQGNEDVKEGNDSPFAHLFTSVRKAQRENITELLNKLKTCPKNHGAITWILERCCREDFSANAEWEEEIRDRLMRIEESQRNYFDNPVK